MYSPYIKIFCFESGEIDVNYKNIESMKQLGGNTFITLSSGKTILAEVHVDVLSRIISQKHEDEIIFEIKIFNEFENDK